MNWIDQYFREKQAVPGQVAVTQIHETFLKRLLIKKKHIKIVLFAISINIRINWTIPVSAIDRKNKTAFNLLLQQHKIFQNDNGDGERSENIHKVDERIAFMRALLFWPKKKTEKNET